MFINFDRMSISKNFKNQSKCNLFGINNYQTPKNIIVYAGDAHIRNYINFIKITFNEKPKYKYNNSRKVTVIDPDSIKDFIN